MASGSTGAIPDGGEVDSPTVEAGGTLTGPGTITGYAYVQGAVSGVMLGATDPSLVDASGQSAEMGVQSGGLASDVTVLGGLTLTVSSGAVASGTTLGPGLTFDDDTYQIVSGIAVDTVVGSGAANQIAFGGVASGSLIGAGGEEIAFYGASVVGPEIGSGGVESLQGGATASGDTLAAGGVGTVSSGAIAIDTTVLSGGVASGAIVDSGGVIDSTDATMDSVGVASPGIANCGDLQSIAYVGWVRGDRTFLFRSTLKTVVGRPTRSEGGALPYNSNFAQIPGDRSFAATPYQSNLLARSIS